VNQINFDFRAILNRSSERRCAYIRSRESSRRQAEFVPSLLYVKYTTRYPSHIGHTQNCNYYFVSYTLQTLKYIFNFILYFWCHFSKL